MPLPFGAVFRRFPDSQTEVSKEVWFYWALFCGSPGIICTWGKKNYYYNYYYLLYYYIIYVLDNVFVSNFGDYKIKVVKSTIKSDHSALVVFSGKQVMVNKNKQIVQFTMFENTTPAQFSCQKRFFGVKMFIRMCRISKWPVPFFWLTIGQDIQDGV